MLQHNLYVNSPFTIFQSIINTCMLSFHFQGHHLIITHTGKRHRGTRNAYVC